MVVQAGIIVFDRPTPSPVDVSKLQQSLEREAANGVLLRFVGGVALMHEPANSNDWLIREGQRLIPCDGGIVTWDGRLDNTEDLKRLCGLDKVTGATSPQVVARCYRNHGSKFVDCLVGDFAFCLWDPKLEKLYMARDPFGTRPLFYAHRETQAVWCSSLKPVLAVAGGSLTLDDQYVAAYLTTSEDWEETPYDTVKSVPPGSLICIGRGGVTVRRFWSPDPKNHVRYGRDSEYEDHFRALFRQSIVCRLLTEEIALAELSGGLDSSSIVCVADDLMKTGIIATRKLETVSYVYEDSPTSDESTFITTVERYRGKRGYRVRDSRILAPTLDEALRIDVPTPLIIYPETFDELSNIMRQLNSRVLLSGMGGDQVLVSDVSAQHLLTDLALDCNFAALRALAHACSQAEKKNYLSVVLSGIASPLLPTRIRSLCAPDGLKVPRWVSRTFARRTDYSLRLLANPCSEFFSSYHSRQQYSMVLQAISVASAGYYRARCAIDVAYPFLDRALVEFLLAVPANQLVRPNESRSLQRRALGGLIPEKTRTRRSKRGPDEALCRALNREWERISQITKDLAISAHGYVDSRLFQDALVRARHGVIDGLQPLMRALALEFWLRARELPDCTNWRNSDEVGRYTGSRPNTSIVQL
jgi:asparagine synthase (glutamine-hydrolysing)